MGLGQDFKTPMRALLPRGPVEVAKLVVESLGVDMLYSGCGDPEFSPTPKIVSMTQKGKCECVCS